MLETLMLRFGTFEYDLRVVYRIHGKFRNDTSWLTDYRSVTCNPELASPCDTPFCEGKCRICLKKVKCVNLERPWSRQPFLRTF